MGPVSDEHGERVHQDFFRIGKKYSGKWSQNILADSCSGLARAKPTGEYKRQKKKLVLNEFFVVRIPYIYRHRSLFDTIYRN